MIFYLLYSIWIFPFYNLKRWYLNLFISMHPILTWRFFLFISIFPAVVLIGGINALPGLRERRDSNINYLELPSNASIVLGNIIPGFDCTGLPYGYYADEANNCAIFHVCLPYVNHGRYFTRHFSFFCGEGTIFDQERLICDYPWKALPCSEAVNFRRSNEYFGRKDAFFLEWYF